MKWSTAIIKELQCPRFQSAMLAISAFVALGIALFTQTQWGWIPCALCVLQRVGFCVIALGAVLGVAVKHKLAWFIQLLGAIGLMVASMAHVSLLSKPAQGCTFDPLGMEINLSWIGQALPWLLQSEGTCWQTGIELLGLHMSSWSLLYSVAALAVVLYRLLETHPVSKQH